MGQLTINNNTSGTQITNISSSNFTINSGLFPLVSGNNLVGTTNGFNQGIVIELNGVTSSVVFEWTISSGTNRRYIKICEDGEYFLLGPTFGFDSSVNVTLTLTDGDDGDCSPQYNPSQLTPQGCCEKTLGGFVATQFKVLVQKVTGDQRPDPSKWKEIDFTTQLFDNLNQNFITEQTLATNTFVITKELYDQADFYDLNDYITLPVQSDNKTLGFGDEYYFYGNVKTDIEATIYEMRYKINLQNTQFQNSSNPTWSKEVVRQPYITEIGLYDEDKNLLVINKFSSPIKRPEANYQFTIKLDF